MRWIFVFAVLISSSAYSQYKSYIIGIHGDTLNTVDMKGLKQGKWVVHVDPVRGEQGFEEEGEFVDGKKEGVWRQYTLQGDLIAMEQYKWGNKNGMCQYFTRNSELLREESWRAVNPLNPYDTVEVADWDKDPLGLITKAVVVKLVGSTIKHGTWKYYDPQTGFVVKTENYILGKIYEPPKKDDVTSTEETDKKKIVPKPKEVQDYEKKNAGKKKIKVREGRTGY